MKPAIYSILKSVELICANPRLPLPGLFGATRVRLKTFSYFYPI